MTTSRGRVVTVGTALLLALVAGALVIAANDSERASADNPLPAPLAGRFRDEHVLRLRDFRTGLPEFWQVDHIPGNDERQRYRDANVTRATGSIAMRAERNADGTITSGAVNVGFDGEGLVRPGDYVQARMRFPAGAGMWGALWLMPLDHESRDHASTPEVDIVETAGTRRARTEHFVHYDDLDEGFSRLVDYTQWHTYGVWLAADGVHYFVDGIEVGVNPATPDPPSGAWGIIANLAVGGLGGDPVASSFPARVELSAVTVWSSPIAVRER